VEAFVGRFQMPTANCQAPGDDVAVVAVHVAAVADVAAVTVAVAACSPC